MLSVNIKKRFADEGVEGFTLDVAFDAPPGVTILFGASGSGKSTTLQAIAGITRPDKGQIRVSEEVFFDSERRVNLAIRKRGVGYVFQNLALFPHLSVQKNIEFGMRNLSNHERRARALEMAQALQIGHTLARQPRDISGGEAQRVALARALASEPRLLLLDEPLSAIDEATKAGIITDLKTINDRLRLPILYVTHSREEAMTIGERVVVYEGGRVVAVGEPLEVFNAPITQTLARLTRVENLFDGIVISKNVAGGTMTVEVTFGVGQCRVEVPLGSQSAGDGVRVAVPSGDIWLATEEPRSTSARNLLRGRVESVEEESARTLVRVVAGVTWQVSVTRQAVNDLGIAAGQEVWLAFKTHSCYLLDK